MSVLLLEAGGPDRHPLIPVPLAFPLVSNNAGYIWRYESEPEPALGGRRLPIRRGRTLGGSSSINGMVHVRGNPADYDRWADRGLTGWSYADVLPYFKRLEDHWRTDDPLRGAAGPIGVSAVNYPGLIYEQIRQAARAAGVPEDGRLQRRIARRRQPHAIERQRR